MKTAKVLKIDASKGLSNGVLTGDKGLLADPAPMMVRTPPAPEGMNEVAAEFWRKKCIHLKQIGRLHAIDMDSLELMANLYSDIKKTRKNMDDTWNTDVYLRHQKSHNEAVKIFTGLAKEFGFTLASRGKIKGGTTGAEVDHEWNEI